MSEASPSTADSAERAERAEGRATPPPSRSPFLEDLLAPGPLVAAELRPPPANLSGPESVDAWIDFDHGVRRLLRAGRPLLFTDDAVGDREEESLRMLTASLTSPTDLGRVVPFLTCKHPLEYCRLFTRRAGAHGLGAVTVTGGDRHVGPPRCLPRSRDLRRDVRGQAPTLPLGAWVNPYRDPVEQVDLLLEAEHCADYFVTQIVSHHDPEPVEAFLAEAHRRGVETPGIFGVFLYRSPRRSTLDRLSDFFPVPVEALRGEFASGASADEVCARTVRLLRTLGVDNVYLSNLRVREAEPRIRRIEARI